MDNSKVMAEMLIGLKDYCKQQGMEVQRTFMIHPDDCQIVYAVSLHLKGSERWVDFDANVLYILKDYALRKDRSTEAMQLKCILASIEEPIVVTVRDSQPSTESSRKNIEFFKNCGLEQIPITWSDYRGFDYHVFSKGDLDMGGFASLMERIEYIGKEVIFKDYGEDIQISD